MSYVFTHGTCKRKDLYDLIINSLVAVGWTNVSSNIADGDVLKSTGMTGTKNLVMQLFPYDAGYYGATTANANNATYSVRTGSTLVNNHLIGVRLPMTYTPGAAGTILRPGQVISRVALINCNAIIDPDATVDYDIYVSKNRLILASKVANIYSPYYQLLHIGIPDTLYVKGEDARNMVFCAASGAGAANTCWTSDFPDINFGSYGDIYPCVWNTLTPPRTPNANGNYFLAEPYIQTDAIGMIGKIDGVYMLSTGSYLANGDIITVGMSKFKALLITNAIIGFNCNWPSTVALIQIQ